MMQKILKIISPIIILLAVNTFMYSQNLSADLKNKRITIDMENKALGYILHHLIVKYDIPIGFERSEADSGNREFDFTTIIPSGEKVYKNTDADITVTVVKNPTFHAKERFFTVKVENKRLEDVLNIIIKQMKGYKWEINNDVVNIFPITGRDKRYKKLLDTKIANFTLGEQEITGLIRNKLFALPEFKEFLNKNNLYSDTVFSTQDWDSLSGYIPKGISFSNLTFKELLNKITKAKRGGWILKQHSHHKAGEKEYVDIDI
jgi:hypothetical protein